MKKLLGVIILAVLLVFGAGCVTTADEIVGTWQTQETDGGFTETITQTLNEDGTGTVVHSYSDGDETITPAVWTKLDDGIYLIAELYSYTFSEDQQSMTDDWGSTFTLEDGAEKIGGVWTMIGSDSSVYTIVLSKDGSGIRTVPQENDEPEKHPFAWREINENQIAWWDLYTFSYTEDGHLLVRDGSLLTETDGVWEGADVFGLYTITGEVIGDFWIEKYSLIENGEYQFTYRYKIQEISEDGMIVGYANTYTQTLQTDGTILHEFGDVFKRVTA